MEQTCSERTRASPYWSTEVFRSKILGWVVKCTLRQVEWWKLGWFFPEQTQARKEGMKRRRKLASPTCHLTNLQLISSPILLFFALCNALVITALTCRMQRKGTVPQHHLYVRSACNFYFPYKYFMIHLIIAEKDR